uniref:NADH-ubiquinone oxidoreductase chain 2 n=1 Tax=Phylloecus linearis TaxID=2816400 RepID=A0A1W6Q579_9HYME|nr:NADH dehydrogenase subunit 2 [Phylloecus linearis]
MMLIFSSSLIISTLIALTSNSWMMIWMMLEVNLMSFLPIMKMNSNNKMNFLFKYFIIQTISSSTFLMAILMIWIIQFNDNFKMINMNFMNLLISFSMILKMGLAPFHFWYIEIMMNLQWMIFLIMSTWQKIIPLLIISLIPMNLIIYMMIILSSLISALQGLTQINLRKIFAFSSINQTSWLTMNSSMSFYLMMMYMMIYMLISFNIMYLFNFNNFSYLHEIYLMNFYSYKTKFLLFSNILSLAGLPPFLGFLIKLISIKMLIFNNLYLITIIMIMASLMTLYFYLRLTYSSMIMINSKNKLNLINMNLLINNKLKFSQLNKLMFMSSMLNFFILMTILILTFN